MNAKHAFLFTFLGSVVMSAAGAGDAQRVCFTGAPAMPLDWPGIESPGVTVPLLINTQSGKVLPDGYPQLNDSTCGFGALDAPGVYSIVQAASAWNSIDEPDLVNSATGDFSSSQTVQTPQLFASPTIGTASTVSFSCAFGTVQTAMTSSGVSENVVTCLETSCWWAGNASGALGTSVTTFNGLGDIIDGDVAINANERFAVSGLISPFYSLVEHNPVLDQVLASGRRGTTPVGTEVFARGTELVDLQGVLTHELGHILGLGHSMVDSRSNRAVLPGEDSLETPVMFPVSLQDMFAEVFTPTVSVSYYSITDNCNTGPSNTYQSASTGEVVLGAGSRTLELDDIAAIWRAYRPVGATTSLSSITGTVFYETGLPALGAHVVAIHSDFPDTIRASSFVYTDDGSFTIDGLPAGEYSVWAEPIDESAYFLGMQVPWFIAPFDPTLSCFTPAASFQSEYWNSPDSGAGEIASKMNYVTTTASGTTSGIDFTVWSAGTNLLTLTPNPGSLTSPRGAFLVTSSGAMNVSVDLSQFPSSIAYNVLIQFSTERVNFTRYGSAVEVLHETGVMTDNTGSEGVVRFLGYPGGSPVSASVTLQSAQDTEFIFVQAYIVDPNNLDRLITTNAASVLWNTP